MSIEAEREAFERWVNVERPSLWRVVTTYIEHADVHVLTAAWDAWQARAALAAPAEPVAHERAVLIAAMNWYRARRHSDWHDTDRPEHRDAGMRLHYTADFELMDAVQAVVTAAPATPAAPAVPQTDAKDAARDVLAERKRQIEAEGWTPEHDDEHTSGAMAVAASCYALAAVADGADNNDYWRGIYGDEARRLWPWDGEWWKPTNQRRMLVKAGALILAEIERLDRAAMTPSEQPAGTGA